MAFGEFWNELAQQRSDDLREESRRVGGARAARTAGDRRSARRLATRRVVHWLRQGQIGTGIAELPEAPLTARSRCV